MWSDVLIVIRHRIAVRSPWNDRIATFAGGDPAYLLAS